MTINMITPIWIDKLENAVKNSKCRSDVLRILGLNTNGSGNHRVVKRWIDKLNISTSHFNYRDVLSKNNKIIRHKAYKPDEFLIEKWTGSMSPIKNWAKDNIKYECIICKNKGEYFGKPLTLQLDHLNGNPLDNRKENLRWLCPNCHTQSDTYAGKGLHLHRKKRSEINPNWNKESKIKSRKVEWPTKEILEKEILENPIEVLGKKYNVSGNSIKNWCKSYGINLMPMGYWTRRQNGYSHEESLISQKKIRISKKRLSKEEVVDIYNLILERKYSLRQIARINDVSLTVVINIRDRIPYYEKFLN